MMLKGIKFVGVISNKSPIGLFGTNVYKLLNLVHNQFYYYKNEAFRVKHIIKV